MNNKNKRVTQVTEPVLSFEFKDGQQIRVWLLDPGQFCKLGKATSMEFPHNPGDKTATLIYESNSIKVGGGHNATAYNIDHKDTWDWIRKWMEKGFKAEGLL